jgi:hypothetical protein
MAKSRILPSQVRAGLTRLPLPVCLFGPYFLEDQKDTACPAPTRKFWLTERYVLSL